MKRRKHPVTQHRLRAVGQHAWSKMQFREEEGHEDRRRWRTPSIIMVWSSCAGGGRVLARSATMLWGSVGDPLIGGPPWEAGDIPPPSGPISLSVTPSIPQGKEIPRYSTLSLSLQVHSAQIAPFPGKYNSANIFSICAAGRLDTQPLYYKLPVRLSASFWTTSTQ